MLKKFVWKMSRALKTNPSFNLPNGTKSFFVVLKPTKIVSRKWKVNKDFSKLKRFHHSVCYKNCFLFLNVDQIASSPSCAYKIVWFTLLMIILAMLRFQKVVLLLSQKEILRIISLAWGDKVYFGASILRGTEKHKFFHTCDINWSQKW